MIVAFKYLSISFNARLEVYFLGSEADLSRPEAALTMMS